MTVATIEFDYEISEERLRAYRSLPDEAKLRWLEDIARFTLLFRAAPLIKAEEPLQEPLLAE